jgi:hypothetical protein
MKGTLRCTGCAYEKSLEYVDQIQSYTCEKCKKVHCKADIKGFVPIDLKVSSTRRPEMPLFLVLNFDLGKVKTLQVIGCAIKCNAKDSSYYWQEYILIDETQELYFLTSYDTTWAFLSTVDIEFNVEKKRKLKSLNFRGRHFTLDTRFQVKILYAEGYFPYDLSAIVKGELEIAEYLSDQKIFSIEQNQTAAHHQGFYGNFLSSKVMLQALSKADPNGKVKVNEYDYRHKRRSWSYWRYLAGFIITFLICGALLNVFRSDTSEKKVFSEIIEVTPERAQKPISYTFNIVGNHTSNLQLVAKHNLDNSWAYLNVTLFNEKTEEERNLEIEVEHYSGYEGGEHWTEGSYEEKKNLNEVSPGPYRLIVYPDADFSLVGRYSSGTTVTSQIISLEGIFHPISYYNLWYVFWLWLIVLGLYLGLIQLYEYEVIHYRFVHKIEDFTWNNRLFLWILLGISICLIAFGEFAGVEIFNNAAPADGMNVDHVNGIHHK